MSDSPDEESDKETLERAKGLTDGARRELANNLRLEARLKEFDGRGLLRLDYERDRLLHLDGERARLLRLADQMEALCPTPDMPAHGAYMPRAKTFDEMCEVYGYEMMTGIAELHKQAILPLFATSSQELSDKQRERALGVLTAAFEEFTGQRAKKLSALAKDLIAAIHEWIGDEPDDDVLTYDEEQYKQDVDDCRRAIADHLLIQINHLTPIPRGVDSKALEYALTISDEKPDDGHIGNRGHDDGTVPDYSAQGSGREHITRRRRTAFDRRKSKDGHLDGTKEIKGDSNKLEEAEAEYHRREIKIQQRWMDRAKAAGYFDEIVGLGPSNRDAKSRIVKRWLMKYERDTAKEKRDAAMKRELERREKEDYDDKKRALKGQSRFKSTRGADDWKAMAAGDDALPEEKRETMRKNETAEQAMEREAREREVAEYTKRKDHKTPVYTEYERKRQETERAVAEAEAEANEALERGVTLESLFADELYYQVEDDDESNLE